MSTNRDTLAGVIETAYNLNEGMVTFELLEAAILAAGYSKHSDELASAKRGAKTLGEIIEKQCRDVLDVTGLHHLINEDGDGHWDVVWMRLFEMRDELSSLKESTTGRERLRGDSWRDRAQEMELARDAAVERAEAAEAALATAQAALDALNDWCGRYKHGFYDEAQDDVGQIIKPYRIRS